ncbi:hypothetical protein CK203_069454 [Vitis vinifera]|uniref:Uncharacterized protein n=1 Tax=Vitis vinifera TaxID=29760 RepID=A0A438BZZ2_VITVI|nr:hypothetical protein CK203_069454 [Vitis vinifera]
MQESSRMGCDNGSEGGIGSAFASPAVSRGAVEKAGTGRSRPRLVKVRKPLNSHNGGLGPGSVSGSNPIDSGFNPFQSGLEISDRVKKSVNTSNGFSDLIGRNMGSEKRGLAESVGQMGANDTGKMNMECGENVGKFENKGFVFGGKRDLGLNLNLGHGESNENFKKPDSEKRGNMGTLNLDDISKMKMPTELECGKHCKWEFELDGDYKNGVFIFGSRSKKSAAFDQTPQLMVTSILHLEVVAIQLLLGPFRYSNSPDELKKLNIMILKDVDGADKTRDSNQLPLHDWIRNAKMDAHGSDDTVGKTNGTDVKTSDDENFVFGSSENTVSSSGGDKSRNPNHGKWVGRF